MPSLLQLLTLGLFVFGVNAMHFRTRAKQMPRRLQAHGSQTLVIDGLGYETNITMGGQQYEVLIDTGSSDLWLATPESIPGSIATDYSTRLTYVDSQMEGPIRVVEVNDFLGFYIPAQAYVEIDPNATSMVSTTGMVGLGPASASRIFEKMPSTYMAVPVLDSIFMANISTPNHLTFYLGRTGDPTDPTPGEITVGTVLDEYSQIIEQPTVPAIRYRDTRRSDYLHFAVYVDSVKGPDGETVPLKTSLESNYTELLEIPPKDGQLLALVDTGYTFSQVPDAMADAIYSYVEGGEKIRFPGTMSEAWILPCTSEINWSIYIGGLEYPIHPMDTVLDHSESMKAHPRYFSTREDRCLGAFQPAVPQVKAMDLDIILGMSFIRNAYTLINFGDFVSDDLKERGDPFLQFLSITDLKEAHEDFVNTRTSGQVAAAVSSGKKSSSTSSSTVKKLSWAAIGLIVGGVILLLVIIGLLARCIFRRRKQKRFKGTLPLLGGVEGKYQKVARGEDDSYVGHQAPQGYQTGAPYAQPQPYGDPWTSGPRGHPGSFRIDT